MNLRAFLFRLAFVPMVISSVTCFFVFVFLAYSIRGSAMPSTLDWSRLSDYGRVILVCFSSGLGFLFFAFTALIFYYLGFITDKEGTEEDKTETLPATA